jgi:hypothetical protein
LVWKQIKYRFNSYTGSGTWNLFHVDQCLIRAYFYAFHTKVTFLMININKTVDPVKSPIRANILTFAAFAATY